MQDVLEALDDNGTDLDGGIRLGKGAYWVFEMDEDGEMKTGRYYAAPRG
jgi:hypothetical protein